MKILIVSDSHDRWDHLEQVIIKGNEVGCEVMLFAGDFMSPPGLSVLETFNGTVHFVLGNNDGELIGLTQMIGTSKEPRPRGARHSPSPSGANWGFFAV